MAKPAQVSGRAYALVVRPHPPTAARDCPRAQVAVLLRGMEGIRLLEKYSAPVLVALTAALLAWAVGAAGGFGPMLAAPSQFGPGMPKAGQFWATFLPALSGQIGYWATLALNIPDFTRCAQGRCREAAADWRLQFGGSGAASSDTPLHPHPPQLRQEPAGAAGGPGHRAARLHGTLHLCRPLGHLRCGGASHQGWPLAPPARRFPWLPC